jgi:S1-C subfamily serine protease
MLPRRAGAEADVVIPGRLCRSHLSFFLVICAFSLFATPIHGQQPDEFISTIEKIKSGVAPVTCAYTAAPSQVNVKVHGTAFFVDAHGVFVTAAHVIQGALDNKACETPALLVRVNASVLGRLNLYGLKFVASECRVDETADIARCKTIADPSEDANIVAKPIFLTITSDIMPEGTPVAFTGFLVNGLIPYTARANIAGYQFGGSEKQGLEVQMLVLDKPAWSGSSGGPVYASNGHVIGLLLQTGNGLAFARHGGRLKEFLNSRP